MSSNYKSYGPNGDQYFPTLTKHSNFNVENDCVALHEAMKGLGTDETGLIEILGNRIRKERLAIRQHYKDIYGVDLLEKFGSELSGQFGKIMKMLVTDSSCIKAKALYEAMKGAGTKESVITEILCTATNEEIHKIKKAYLTVLSEEGISDASRSLESDLKSELSGDYEHLIIALLQGKRAELTEEEIDHLKNKRVKNILDPGLIRADVDALYDAGEGRLGTDESTFIRIFAGRHRFHLQAVAGEYEKKSGRSLYDAIKSETSGNFGRALKLVYMATVDPLGAYAELLRKSMAGLGTEDSTLMRIIVTRSEIDLKDIARVFNKNNEQPLVDWVRGDTSGDYRKVLLALLGVDWHEE